MLSIHVTGPVSTGRASVSVSAATSDDVNRHACGHVTRHACGHNRHACGHNRHACGHVSRQVVEVTVDHDDACIDASGDGMHMCDVDMCVDMCVHLCTHVCRHVC